jgi:polysaccharide pyruvyl transferase WcaK-like protein
MKGKKKFLITGGGFVNKGAEAMLCTVKQELGKRIPDADFICVSRTIEEHEKALSLGFHSRLEQRGNYCKKLSSIFCSAIQHPSVLESVLIRRDVTELFGNVSAVINISGYAYSDIQGYARARNAWAAVKYCDCFKIPYIFMPQAWGPFSEPKLVKYIEKMCKYSFALYVRDEYSKVCLKPISDRIKKEIFIGPDIAFRFQGDLTAGGQIFHSFGESFEKGPVIGVGPNMRVYERMAGNGTENKYVNILTKLVKSFRNMGVSIVLLPHEIRTKSFLQDDRYICRLIKEDFEHDDKVAVISDNLSAAEIKGVIQKLDLLIASRFHSIVAALSSRVPVFVIGWSHKYGELLHYFGIDNCALDYENIDRIDFLNSVKSVWKDRHNYKTMLENKVPDVEKAVDQVFDKVATCLQ